MPTDERPGMESQGQFMEYSGNFLDGALDCIKRIISHNRAA